MVINSWTNNRSELSAYFEYSEPIRRIIYTTNTVEGFNRQIRKITKSKGGFSNDESLLKLVFLVYGDTAKKWEKSISNWAEIISQLSIHYVSFLHSAFDSRDFRICKLYAIILTKTNINQGKQMSVVENNDKILGGVSVFTGAFTVTECRSRDR